ncbi:MAG TPA: M23 family metallopeptidase [Nannocystaceae bacterium]|nr:M23 family metallopeptidase [Nannocystaceae bacterium]
MIAWIIAALVAGEPFYRPAGELVPGSGEGAADETVYAPGMRYPVRDAPSYPNSQVWGHGGNEGPGGSQCDAENFSYPWHDNYCETRSWDMPLCPSGVGHQGQDIRASSCENAVHPFVAAREGTVTNIGSYSVYITAADGQRFDYLHGAAIAVSSGEAVAREQQIGMVSNQFGGTATTVHLHFNIKQDVGGVGFVFVSPYMSLVAAYEELTGLGTELPAGPVDAVDCTSIRGWAQDPDVPDQPVEIRAWFDGPADDAGATGITLLADVPRDDLCGPLGSCEHGFEIEVPRSLADNVAHEVFIYAVDDGGAETPQLDASPGSFTCAPPQPPAGVRRRVDGPEAIATWSLSTFWDMAKIDDATLEAIDEGPALPMDRLIVRGDSDAADAVWLIDNGRKRSFADAAVRERWHVTEAEIQSWPQASVDGVPEGTPMRGDIFMVSGSDLVVYLIDDAQCPADETCDGAEGDSGSADDSDGGDDATPGTADGEGDGTGSDESGSLPGARGENDSGCGCSHERHSNAWWLWLIALGYRPRRSSNKRVSAARECTPSRR